MHRQDPPAGQLDRQRGCHLASRSAICAATFEVFVENRSDGMLGLKVKDPLNGQSIPFGFERHTGEVQDFIQVEKFVQSIPINAI